MEQVIQHEHRIHNLPKLLSAYEMPFHHNRKGDHKVPEKDVK